MVGVSFVLAVGGIVFVLTSTSLLIVKCVCKRAATRDSALFGTVCISLLTPWMFLAAMQAGFSWSPFHSADVDSLVLKDHSRVSGLDAESLREFRSKADVAESLPPAGQAEVLAVDTNEVNDRETSRSASSAAWLFNAVRASWQQLLVLTWGLGTCLLVARFICGQRYLARIIASSDPVKLEWAERIWSVVPNSRDEFRSKVFISAHVKVPCAVGTVSPRVLLPASCAQLSDEQLGDIVSHELAHVNRRDPLKLFLQQLATIVYWPIVPMHVVSFWLSEAREEVCDMHVLETRDAVSYGETLVMVARMMSATKATSFAPASFLPWHPRLERRMQNLLSREVAGHELTPSWARLIATMVSLCFVLAVTCVIAAPPQAASRTPSDASDLAERTDPDSEISATVNENSVVTQNADSSPTPNLTVRVVDKSGEAVVGADVLVYDEQKILAGKEARFKNALKRTDSQGECDFGTMPLDHVTILVRGRAGEFSESSVHVFASDPGPRLSENRLVSLDSREDRLVVTHTVRKGVDLQFEVLDAETGRPIHFAAIHWKDEAAKRWRNVALLDSGGQQNGTTLVPEMGRGTFRAARAGYAPVDFSLGKELVEGTTYRHQVKLEPRPKRTLTILTPDGRPADSAEVQWANEEHLTNEEHLRSEADARGVLEIRHPPHPKEATFVVTHPSGLRSMTYADIPADGKITLRTARPRLNVRVLNDAGAPVKNAKVWVGDGDRILGSQDVAFEIKFQRTDDRGIAEFGEAPHDFLRVHVSGDRDSHVYAKINESRGRFSEVTPRRYFVDLQQTDAVVELTVRLTPPTPVRFKVIDAMSGEDVVWPEIFVRREGRWWMLALIDGAGQHNIAPVIAAMEGAKFRVTASGYVTEEFELHGLRRDGIEHTVKMRKQRDDS